MLGRGGVVEGGLLRGMVARAMRRRSFQGTSRGGDCYGAWGMVVVMSRWVKEKEEKVMEEKAVCFYTGCMDVCTAQPGRCQIVGCVGFGQALKL